MRASPVWLLAFLPWGLEPCARQPLALSPPAALALEVRVRAPLETGTLEVHLMTGDAGRRWTPYAVAFCSNASSTGCDGLEVRFRVLVAQDALAPARVARAL
jgi:hypothetical protein